MFIPLEPNLLDAGPMIATICAGCAGTFSALVGAVWMIAQLFRIKKWKVKVLGYTTCFITSTCMMAALGTTTYVFIAEGKNRLPPLFYDWQDTFFTREYYVCTAIPSLLTDTNPLYGFSVCDHAQAARCILVSVSAVSLALTVLCVVQTYKQRELRQRKFAKFDIGKKAGRTATPSRGLAITMQGSSCFETSAARQIVVGESTVKKPEPTRSSVLMKYGGFYTRI
ncbi:hypothetical protein P154DRAFT_14448 [Amniculicola lignicola CBS 123094]|uniref:Uncharacterized protein n=1 Tax=Amniculicola lignicola CBS 123094 TaxID=1392246 RepID=A0A6A5X5B8_9PLEO|nr:hypothetical protein P154DRAFT_14448 [Amniculicola lignicola CBS 123094]